MKKKRTLKRIDAADTLLSAVAPWAEEHKGRVIVSFGVGDNSQRAHQGFSPAGWEMIDEECDFEDVDCEDCGMKFYVRPSLFAEEYQARRVKDGLPRNEWPRKCGRCQKRLPPLYEY